jgi:hypothetical protein
VNSSLALSVIVGEKIDIVVWNWSDWDRFTDELKILKSFKDQIWRFRFFPEE